MLLVRNGDFYCLQLILDVGDDPAVEEVNGALGLGGVWKKRARVTNHLLYTSRHAPILEKISRELGFDRTITFHRTRHSFAVMAINKGMRIEVLSKLLGHSSIIATEKIYARFLRSTMDDEIRKVMVRKVMEW